MSDNHIRLDEQSDGIGVLAIVRPDKRNAISLAMWSEIGRVVQRRSADGRTRAVVLCGSGGYFSAGADIGEFQSLRGNPIQAKAYEAIVDSTLQSLLDAPFPVIAAVTGPCFGGGLALADACDFRIANSEASFCVPAARLGLVYNLFKCRNLVGIVGLPRARRILLGGRPFSARDGFDWGLVDEIADDPVDRAIAVAVELSASAPLAVAGMKKILNRIAAGGDLPAGAFDDIVDRATLSSDHREAVEAFAQKRAPRFKGV